MLTAISVSLLTVHVFTFKQVHWHRSADIPLTALHYALLQENKAAVTLLVDDHLNSKKDRSNQPKTALKLMDTGSYVLHI